MKSPNTCDHKHAAVTGQTTVNHGTVLICMECRQILTVEFHQIDGAWHLKELGQIKC